MGLIANVYRNYAPGSLNRVQTSQVCIVNIDAPFEPCEDMPAVILAHGNLPGMVKIVPVSHENVWLMFGGAFVASSDSRFNDAVEKMLGTPFYGAVPLHDRAE